MEIFSSPIICLDGDESGQRAAFRDFRKIISFINEKNKIYFSIMAEGKDPDDFIKENGKEEFLKLLEDKKIIQSFIWNYNLNKINLNNPFEVSNFEKEIKKLTYSIKDEILKKYVLEDFLEKLKKLTPLQANRQKFSYSKFSKQNVSKILQETKILHQKTKDLSKIQIIEFSILYIILNYTDIISKKIEEISECKFLSEKNELLKNTIIEFLSEGSSKTELNIKINDNYKNLINEIKENSNIQLITKNKNDQEIIELFDELILEFKEQNNLRKIESLEKKLINNLDESSYSELLKLKNQLNRE